MAEKISWTLNVAIAGGPKISDSNAIEVGAYDKVGLVVKAKSKEKVEVQPGAAGQVQLLLISADPYGTALTYRVNDENGTAVALDGLQLFIGGGGVSLLDKPPQTFFVDNQMDTDAAVEILVGRKATTGATPPADDQPSDGDDGQGDGNTAADSTDNPGTDTEGGTG